MIPIIILSRAGSKGVPGKNIAPIAGRPCIAWTIDLAQQTIASINATSPAPADFPAHTGARRKPPAFPSNRALMPIAISSDCPRALRLAAESGLWAIERPAPLASDTARIDDAARHAIEAIETELHTRCAAAIILYANVPVRPIDCLSRAISLWNSAGCHSIQSFTSVEKAHPWWMATIGADARLSPWEGHQLFHGVYRRQDLPPAFLPDGALLLVSRESLFAASTTSAPHAFLGTDRRAIINPHGSVIDIDSPIDLALAEVLLSQSRARLAA